MPVPDPGFLYASRGLDDRGWPTREALEAVGLNAEADVLYGK